MLGATETASGPELAPVGKVIAMLDSLQELIVVWLPFSKTALLPCVDPKFAPLITTWLPIAPVVADTLLIIGAGAAAEFTDTLSIADVAKVELDWLLTTKPMYTFVAIVIVWLVPTCTQLTPSSDAYPLNVFPLLTTLSQYGNAAVRPLDVLVLPPVVSR